MTTYSDVYTWLNFEQPSHLCESSIYSVWEIKNRFTLEPDVSSHLEALIQSLRAANDEFELAEILMFAGKTQAEAGQFNDSMRYLGTAANIYKRLKDPFRESLARWLLSMVEWRIGENNLAHANARSAYRLFESVSNEHRQELQNRKHLQPELQDRVNWLSERYHAMGCDLMEKPEEAFTWLNRFEDSYLSSPLKMMRANVFTAINNHDRYRANDLLRSMQQIVRIASDPNEQAEVHAFRGLIYHQMGDGEKAERAFRLSTSLFAPQRHHHTVVRWMQALVHTCDSMHHDDAIRLCNDCINSFEKLRLDADHHNQSSKCAWYETQAAGLKYVMERIITRA